MKRSILLLFIVMFCLTAIPAGADVQKAPNLNSFLLAQDRLQENFGRGNPIYWSLSALPDAFSGFELSALDLLQSIVSKMEVTGVLQSNKDGSGWMDFAILMNNDRISSFSQMTRDGRIGMQMNSSWFSTSEDEEDLARAMLSFDALGESLLSFPYDQVRTMKTPFVSPLSQAGFRLWELASPWSADNNGLSSPSGATSHALTYTIDTVAARSILSQWSDSLSIDQFQYGLEGTDLFIGIDEEGFNQFIQRIRNLSQTIEMSTPLVVNMTFGEGDALSYAKGSGKVSVGGKRSDISVRYTREASKSKIKHRLTIDFQPKQSDTLVLDLTISHTSHHESSVGYDVKLTANGVFDGLPYQLHYDSQLTNHYLLLDDAALSEVITGTIIASLKYDGNTVADIAIQQDTRARSVLAQKAVTIEHTYHTTLKDKEGVLFSGPISLSLEMKEEPEEPPSMESTLFIEAMDFIELETLRESITNAQATLEQNVLDILSPVASIVQRGSQ